MPEIDDADEKCECGKRQVVAVTKALHRTPNPGSRPEPAVPQGRKIDAANISAVPADSPAARIRDGAQVLAAHRAYLEAQAAGGGTGGTGGGDAPGAELGVTFRGTTGGLPASLRVVDASRCQLQGNNLGRLSTGRK
jgi:hypothetical protein